jgi:hypothetical protein
MSRRLQRHAASQKLDRHYTLICKRPFARLLCRIVVHCVHTSQQRVTHPHKHQTLPLRLLVCRRQPCVARLHGGTISGHPLARPPSRQRHEAWADISDDSGPQRPGTLRLQAQRIHSAGQAAPAVLEL